MFIINAELTDFMRLRFSSTGRFLAIDGGRTNDGREGYELWELPPKPRRVHAAGAVVLRNIEWHPSEAELYVPRHPSLDVVVPSGEVLRTIPDLGWVAGLLFSPQGDWLVAYSPFQLIALRRVQDSWLSEWSVVAPAETTSTPEHSDSFRSAAPFPDGLRMVALVSRRQMVPYTDSRGREAPHSVFPCRLVERQLACGRVLAERSLSDKETPLGVRTRLVVTPDGEAIIGFRDRSVCVWPSDASRPVRRVAVAKKDVWDVVLHPSGQWLMVVCDGPEVAVWDTTNWKAVRNYDWGIGRIRCAAISPDGLLAAAGNADGNVAVWDWDL